MVPWITISNTERSAKFRKPDESLRITLLGKQAPQLITRHSLQPPPSILASLSTSTPVCSLSGQPKFTILLDWRLTSDRTICASRAQREGRSIGLEIRDPERNGRRIGPSSDYVGDDEGEPSDDEIFLRLARRDDCDSQYYVFTVEPKQDGLVPSDTYNLASGKAYELTLRKAKWRWLYADELDEAALQDTGKIVERLQEEPQSEWKPDCRAEFRAA